MIPEKVYKLYRAIRPKYFRERIKTGASFYFIEFYLEIKTYTDFLWTNKEDRAKFVLDNFDKIKDVYDVLPERRSEYMVCLSVLTFTNIISLTSFIASLGELVNDRKKTP